MLILILILTIIAVIVAASWFIIRGITNYHKSDKYIQKEKERLTRPSDVRQLAEEYNISPEYEKIIAEFCRNEKLKNIKYLIKNSVEISEILRKHYFKLKEKKADAKTINDFFTLQYKFEEITAKTKRLRHTNQIPDGSVVFYISTSGEQLPLNLIKKSREALYLELPDFLVQRKQEPKLLERNRYSYKSNDGISYTFSSRTIRYEKNEENKNIMLIAHTEKLLTEVQRHYKREYSNIKCTFSPMQVIRSSNSKEDDSYIISDKTYLGILTNISGGGCCIKNELPIKEGQYLNVNLSELGIKETVIGLIKKTRKLPDGFFALHIQFIELTIETQNKILTYVYKYEI